MHHLKGNAVPAGCNDSTVEISSVCRKQWHVSVYSSSSVVTFLTVASLVRCYVSVTSVQFPAREA